LRLPLPNLHFDGPVNATYIDPVKVNLRKLMIIMLDLKATDCINEAGGFTSDSFVRLTRPTVCLENAFEQFTVDTVPTNSVFE